MLTHGGRYVDIQLCTIISGSLRVSISDVLQCALSPAMMKSLSPEILRRFDIAVIAPVPSLSRAARWSLTLRGTPRTDRHEEREVVMSRAHHLTVLGEEVIQGLTHCIAVVVTASCDAALKKML